MLNDFHNLDRKQIFHRYKKFFSGFLDFETGYSPNSDVEEYKNKVFLTQSESNNLIISELNEIGLILGFLIEIKFLEEVDWSGEAYAGQIKRFLHRRLKEFGGGNIKLNDNPIKQMLKEDKVKRGEWIPLLLNCFDKQLIKSGYKIALFGSGEDEYRIALLTLPIFSSLLLEDIDIWDTKMYELELLEIGSKKSEVMYLLKKEFDLPLNEVKAFLSNLPVHLGQGLQTDISALKVKYEKAGCLVKMMEI